jgi:hypothetical protein
MTAPDPLRQPENPLTALGLGRLRQDPLTAPDLLRRLETPLAPLGHPWLRQQPLAVGGPPQSLQIPLVGQCSAGGNGKGLAVVGTGACHRRHPLWLRGREQGWTLWAGAGESLQGRRRPRPQSLSMAAVLGYGGLPHGGEIAQVSAGLCKQGLRRAPDPSAGKQELSPGGDQVCQAVREAPESTSQLPRAPMM